MTRATILQEVRQIRFEALYARRQQRTLTMAEAAEMLGITERTFRRWSGRDATDGAEGLQDRRLGRGSARAVPVDEALRMVTRDETRSTGWTVKHVHERWQAEQAGGGPIVGRRRPYRLPDMWTGHLDEARIARSGRAHRCPG